MDIIIKNASEIAVGDRIIGYTNAIQDDGNYFSWVTDYAPSTTYRITAAGKSEYVPNSHEVETDDGEVIITGRATRFLVLAAIPHGIDSDCNGHYYGRCAAVEHGNDGWTTPSYFAPVTAAIQLHNHVAAEHDPAHDVRICVFCENDNT